MAKLDEGGGGSVAAEPDASSIGLGPYAALAGGSAADLGTTIGALHRGGQELNPLLQGGTAGLVAGKAASTAALLWAMRALAKNGHPTAAKVIGYGGGAALGGLALRNAGVQR